MDVSKEGGFQKITPKSVLVLSPEYAHLPEGMKFVYAMIALLSEGENDVIIPAPIRELEARNLRPLRSELPAVLSDILNAMRRFKDHLLHMLVLHGVLGFELSNFSRKLMMKPGIEDDYQKRFRISNDLWFGGMQIDEEEKPRWQNAKETKAHLEAMVFRTKPEANKWLHLTTSIAPLGMDAFERGPTMITKIHAYLVRELNLSENEGEKSAEFIVGLC